MNLRDALENLQRPNLHDAIKRNTMKAVAALEVPDDLAGAAAELRLSIEHQLPHETRAAFHSRARHVLRALDRIDGVGRRG